MTKKRAKKKASKQKQEEDAATKPDTDEESGTTVEDAPADAGPAPQAAEEDLDSLQDRYLRLRADFENFKARTRREKHELYRRANQDLMLEMLPVLDHLDLALAAADEHGADPAFVEGFRLVADQLAGVLKRFSLSPIETEGEAFDPNRHEAITHEPSDEVPENHIIGETRRGYLLGGELLRPSQVRVSSGPAGSHAEDGGEKES